MRPRLPRVDEEATMTRRDIEFDAEGVTLRGWFYPAQGATGVGPTVVMAHGFSAVKEMYLDSFAEVFSAAGLSRRRAATRRSSGSPGRWESASDPGTVPRPCHTGRRPECRSPRCQRSCSCPR